MGSWGEIQPETHASLIPAAFFTIKGSNFASKSARLLGSMHGITTAFVGGKVPLKPSPGSTKKIVRKCLQMGFVNFPLRTWVDEVIPYGKMPGS